MHCFVIGAEDLVVLNDLKGDYPRPMSLVWINRGTDQQLKAGTLDLLMRTLYRPITFSKSVAKLHSVAGLRIVFATGSDRWAFAAAFLAAASRRKNKGRR